MSKKKEIIRDGLIFSLANQLTQFITAITGILSRNFLGPVQMGIYSTLQIVLQYASYTALGTTQGIARDVPYYIGKKDRENADQLKDMIVSFQIVTGTISAIGIGVGTILFRDKIPAAMFWGLLVIAILVILQRIHGLLISLLRAYKQFESAGKQMILSALVNLVLILVLASRWQLYGFLMAMVLSFIFNIAYVFYIYPMRFKFHLNLVKLKSIIAFGLPLMILSVLEGVYKSIDKLFIVNMLGFKMLGWYSVALMASNLMNQLPNSVATVIIPHFQEKYGERDSVKDLYQYVRAAAFGLSLIMPIFVGAAWIMLPWLIQLLMPDYVEGARSAQLLILGSFFAALSIPYGTAIVTLKKHLRIFPMTGITLALAAVFDYIAIRAGWGINGVALTTSVTLTIQFILYFFIAGTLLFEKRSEFLGVFKALGFFLALLSVLFALEIFSQGRSLGAKTLTQMILFLFFASPLLYRLKREYLSR